MCEWVCVCEWVSYLTCKAAQLKMDLWKQWCLSLTVQPTQNIREIKACIFNKKVNSYPQAYWIHMTLALFRWLSRLHSSFFSPKFPFNISQDITKKNTSGYQGSRKRFILIPCWYHEYLQLQLISKFPRLLNFYFKTWPEILQIFSQHLHLRRIYFIVGYEYDAWKLTS